MNKNIIKTMLAILLMALAISLVACGKANIYDSLGKDGYTVKIRYDAGDAVVNGTQNVTIVEVFSEDDVVTTADGKTGIQLLAPNDPLRGADGVFNLAKSDGENNYFSTGWYTSKTPRVDEQGQALDAYGVPVSISGREQGYIYEGKWDFEKDVVDPEKLENGEMTLYASWVPFFKYEFYAKNESGSFELIKSENKIDLTLPKWNERTGKLSINDFPKIKDKTFYSAYLDEAMTNEITENIDGDNSFVDYDKGIATVTTIKIYTTWLDGSWQKIYTAEQFADDVELGGNYILGADLDFTDVEWPTELSEGIFTGAILGEGFSIKNVLVTQSNAADPIDALFGNSGEVETVQDVTFENITYKSPSN